MYLLYLRKCKLSLKIYAKTPLPDDRGVWIFRYYSAFTAIEVMTSERRFAGRGS